MQNDTYERTQESHIGATNANNYANVARSNLNKELDEIELGRYTKNMLLGKTMVNINN